MVWPGTASHLNAAASSDIADEQLPFLRVDNNSKRLGTLQVIHGGPMLLAVMLDSLETRIRRRWLQQAAVATSRK